MRVYAADRYSRQLRHFFDLFEKGVLMSIQSIARLSLIVGAIALLAAFAAPAMAATAIPISMTLVENNSKQPSCTNALGLCGVGEVVPLGQATETIQFGAGCGSACDLRTLTLANGSLIIDETFSPDCLRGCAPNAFTGTLSDVIVGGTGAYAGAGGTLTGSVRAVGGAIHIKLLGTLILP